MYSTIEAAEKLGLSQDHVRLLARTGIIEAKKLGHDWVVLNLDYKRKRRLKATNYFKLTPSVTEEIPGDKVPEEVKLEKESPPEVKSEEILPDEISPAGKKIKGAFLVYHY